MGLSDEKGNYFLLMFLSISVMDHQLVDKFMSLQAAGKYIGLALAIQW